eukprot:Sspe_Gene.30433::Locus_15066_Transcript_1_1_Confidence_1.000_Length_1182::g.30433::m.30433
MAAAAVAQLKEQCADGEAFQATLATLMKLGQNPLEHPDEDKYRRVKADNNQFREKVGKYPAALEVLKLLGFAEQGDEYVLQGEVETDVLETLAGSSGIL